MPPRDAQLPLEALRDLVGIVRALFAAWTKARVGPLELEELLHIGRELRAALNLASKTQPGTVGHRAAWSRAEDATRLLGHLVGQLEALHPVIEAASERALASAAAKANKANPARQPAKMATVEARNSRKSHERNRH